MENTKFDIDQTRNSLVAKRADMVQRSRFNLDLIENKAITYLISKVQPDDKPGKHYIFNCKEFQTLIKWNNTDTYFKTKAMLTRLASNSWWIDCDDGKEALVRWFNIVHMNKGTGEIEISFHDDMFPYLLELRKQQELYGAFYMTYKLQYITLMKHRYSPKLYEILKSYQYNNQKWTFENGTGSKYDIQRLLANTDPITGKSQIPARWSGWKRFSADVLDPAVEEINHYTDIKVSYLGKKEDLAHRKCRGVATIEFYMSSKTSLEQQDTDQIIDSEYVDSFKCDNGSIAEHEKMMQGAADTADDDAFSAYHYPVVAEELASHGQSYTDAQVSALVEMALDTGSSATDIPWKKRELWATDFILYYLRQIQGTPEDTKTTVYKRLYDMIKKDYDSVSGVIMARLMPSCAAGGAVC